METPFKRNLTFRLIVTSTDIYPSNIDTEDVLVSDVEAMLNHCNMTKLIGVELIPNDGIMERAVASALTPVITALGEKQCSLSGLFSNFKPVTLYCTYDADEDKIRVSIDRNMQKFDNITQLTALSHRLGISNLATESNYDHDTILTNWLYKRLTKHDFTDALINSGCIIATSNQIGVGHPTAVPEIEAVEEDEVQQITAKSLLNKLYHKLFK